MKYIRLIILFAIAAAAASSGAVQAQIGGAASFSQAPAAKPQLQTVGYGCGWDYPCPPRPYYGKRHYRFNYASRNGQVNIHNNYGNVNVYVNGQRHGHRRYHPSRNRHHECSSYNCDRASWQHVERRDTFVRVDPDRGVRSCGGYPCSEPCGTWCWYRRFKGGYCGHGCDVYRQRVRFEEEERTIRVPRPIFSEVSRRDDFEDGADDRRGSNGSSHGEESYSNRRYYGPPYPP